MTALSEAALIDPAVNLTYCGSSHPNLTGNGGFGLVAAFTGNRLLRLSPASNNRPCATEQNLLSIRF